MAGKIRIGIVGYGNIGKSVEMAVESNHDLEVGGVFTRRNPAAVEPQVDSAPVFQLDKALDFKNDLDVMILCGGSATDLPEQSPYFARYFNLVDSYDNHAKIPEHYRLVDKEAREGETTAAISIGWDPGLFSLYRMMAEGILPDGDEYTFFGPGVSQGHSDAVRRVAGVKAGVQYTIPINSTMDKVREGETPELRPGDKQIRECYVVAEEGADLDNIAREIKNMPNYFEGYETRVYFISEAELAEKHSDMPHGGFVIRNGRTGQGQETKNHIMEFALQLRSNPQFTANVLVAYARAVYYLHREGFVGAKTIFEIPPAFISPRSGEEMRREML